MLFRRLCVSISKSNHNPFFLSPIFNPLTVWQSNPVSSSNFKNLKLGFQITLSVNSQSFVSGGSTTNSTMDDPRRPPFVPIPHPETVCRAEVFRALEAALGAIFSSQPTVPNPNPLIIVISGNELLECALVYGDYKGIPKQQIREYMAKGCDIVLRVDIQGAATLRGILRYDAVFLFLVAESEEALVKRLIDQKTESIEALLMRVASAREELRHLKEFDYVVVNKEGELENS